MKRGQDAYSLWRYEGSDVAEALRDAAEWKTDHPQNWFLICRVPLPVKFRECFPKDTALGRSICELASALPVGIAAHPLQEAQ